ncbi:MAG: hypothetical protein KKA90_02830 [Nanoarchaeota archaeon]|nr:hypothetical protein [Nanoarchaeota archaeon]
MALKVGVTSGIYYAARSEELSTIMRKLGYTLTRGTSSMELAADVAHEVPYTQGYEIRHIAKKQGVTLAFHGDLTVPFEIPERGEWRDAQDRVYKSLRSAVYLGAKYIDFHACLNIWLELVTYTGRKLTMSFCDHMGRFIKTILKENEDLREWFIRKKGDIYYGDIVNREEQTVISSRYQLREDRWKREETDHRLRSELAPYKELIEGIQISSPRGTRNLNYEEFVEDFIEAAIIRGIPRKTRHAKLDRIVEDIFERLRKATVEKNAEIQKEEIDNFLREKFMEGDPWESEELRRAPVGMLDGYHIMGHYLFYTKDPQWVAMTKEYPELMQRYKLDYSDKRWLENAWQKAEDTNDREFKEFFYAAICAKFIEGHLRDAFHWIEHVLIKKEIPEAVNSTNLSATEKKKEIETLTQNARNLIIGLENPDAREAQYAGLYFIWRPKQMYALIKTLQKTLNTNHVMMIVDNEHIATQGVDVLVESRKDVLTRPDFGEIVISVHANHPNPLHPHNPLEIGDIELYELIYNLCKTGLGKKQTAFLMFERGGAQDPFQKSVDVLREVAKYAEKLVKPENLPMEFFGMKGLTAGDIERQRAIIRDKAWEPLKDLLQIPEEDWTMLSREVLQKGKKPEQWKRGEFR